MPATVSAVPARPPRNLRRAPWRHAPFAALDFETTGLGPRDAVVAFGVVPVEGGRVVLGRAVERLVASPLPSSPRAMRVHEILPRDLDGAPTMRRMRAELARALDGRFLLAWYADVEVAFLARIFGTREGTWRRRTIDVRGLALALDPARASGVRFTLAATAERYGIPVTRVHEALEDALLTAQLFLVLASRFEARGQGAVRSLLARSRC
ncbi:MAG: hypothetical protein KatS3mg014_1141 [Actinomycetota bacterium]|nr:MAG: hypothetical protein KatS3mg014_1141 [Actinomycetota bacterium]